MLVAVLISCYAGFLFLTMHEARQSQLGRILEADVVTIDRVAGFLDQRSSDVAPDIEFLVRVCIADTFTFCRTTVVRRHYVDL